MPTAKFLPQPEEEILFHTTPNRKWYVYGWKIISGTAGITVLIFLLYSLLARPTETVLLSFLSAEAARTLINIFYLGLCPLAALAWIAEDVAATYIGEFILTNLRIWIRGSPYVWSQIEIPVDDIASLIWRRDAFFLRRKSTHKIQVHMFPDGKLLVKAYEQFIGKSITL